MTITRKLKTATVVIDPEHQTVSSTFVKNGQTLVAAPTNDEHDYACAHSLGYRGDTWRMCIEHELLHNWYADTFGLEISPSLERGLEGHTTPTPETQKEEEFLFAIQRLINTGEGGDEVLTRLLEKVPNLLNMDRSDD